MRTSGNSVKLSSDICDRILGVASKSVSLQEIHVPSIGARWEFAARLSQVSFFPYPNQGRTSGGNIYFLFDKQGNILQFQLSLGYVI